MISPNNEKLWKSLQSVEPKLRLKYLNTALKAGAKDVQADAKINVPIDVGFLRKSIKVQKIVGRYRQKDFTGYVVGLDKDARNPYGRGLGVYPSVYGRIVETGSHKMEARPFIYPALVKNQQNVLQKAIQKVKEFLNGSI